MANSHKHKRPTIVLAMKVDDEVLSPVVAEAKARGWQFVNLLYTSNVLPPEGGFDGAIVRELPRSPLARKLRKLGCPAVRIGSRPNPDDDRLPAVFPDLDVAGELAAEHFAERRFEYVGYIGHTPWRNCKPLYDAFRRRSEELGLAVDLLKLPPQEPQNSRQRRYAQRERQIRGWLNALPRPIGILAYNQILAGRLCYLCQAGGLAVPEEVSILANGDFSVLCETAPIPLSAIDKNMEQVAREAVELLASLMEGQRKPPARTAVPPRGVIERRSTSVLAVSDPGVARAIRFIWDHLDRSISVDDIARAAGVSRTRLERGFRRCLNRGINAELQRKRLEHFTELLQRTDQTIAEVAAASGFHNRGYLHRLFRKTHGQTPRQYRQACKGP